jgi:4-amino-4-deoxy-L-arabinose transferase-like glycosyltransferase
LGAFALALRLLWLGRESLWVDETYTWHVAHLSLAAILTLQDQTPPLYNVLMHFWVRVAGDSEWALRLPSAALGAGAVLVLYRLGCRLARPRVAALGALLLALSFFHLRYSQTARTYALFVFLATLSMSLFLRVLEGKGRRPRTAYVAATAALLYSHPYALTVVAVQALAVLWPRRPDAPSVLALQAAAALAFVPWLPVLAGRVLAVNAGFWIPGLGVETVRRLGSAGLWYAPLGARVLVDVGLVGLGSFAAWRLLRPTATQPPPHPRPVPPRTVGVLLVGWTAGPLAAGLLLSLAWQPVLTPAYLLVSWPGAYLLVASGVGSLPRPSLRAAAAILLVVAFAWNLAAGMTVPQNQDWRGAAGLLRSTAQPGDVVLSSRGYCGPANPPMQCPLDFYGVPADVRLVPFLDHYRQVGPGDIPLLANATAGAAHIWVVYADEGDPGRLIASWLEGSRGPAQDWHLNKLEILRFGPG